MKRIALIGGTGYLGRYVAQQLETEGYSVSYLARSAEKLYDIGVTKKQINLVDVTNANTLVGTLKDVDCVISCLGITRQKDGFSYMDIDYQANLNVLNEAKRSGVKKFIYVSVFRGAEFQHVSLCRAKEKFVTSVINSGLDYSIVRPNGFFSDLRDFYDMAKSGRIFLFGSGQNKLNPIHGADLANVIVDSIQKSNLEINIGGPDVFTHNQIAQLAINTQPHNSKLTHIPDTVRRAALTFGKYLMPSTTFGPVEFFLTMLGEDMVAPTYGEHRLADFYNAFGSK